MFSRLRHYLSGRSETRPTGGEGPRGFVGGLWDEMGDLQFKFLLNNGLQPENVFLDIACGSLRLGCRIIPFLGSGNYLGIDIKEDLIEHGKAVELGEDLCRIKTPEFIVSDSFEFEKFSKPPDVAIAQSLFSHLIVEDIVLCLTNLSKYCVDNTIFYATFFEVDSPVVNPPKSHPHGVYQYTRGEMEEMGNSGGWKMDYIGDWDHPRKQNMVRYTIA